MSAAENQIVSLQQVKDRLKIASNNLDSFLSDMINIASDEIEQYCGCKFALQTITDEITDGDGSRRLFPKYFPIAGLAHNALSDLQYRDSTLGYWKNLLTTLDELIVENEYPFIELVNQIFPVGRRNIKLSYKCGYQTIPGDVVRVALEMVQIMWNESKQGGDWLGRNTKGQMETGQSRSFELKNMRPEWYQVLDRYRRITI